ncbi:MAG: hypothetical protein R3Y26_05280 [Rikenellaceae bacterium]
MKYETITFKKSALFNIVRSNINGYLDTVANDASIAEITEEDAHVVNYLLESAINNLLGALTHLRNTNEEVNSFREILILELAYTSREQRQRLPALIERYLVKHAESQYLQGKGLSSKHIDVDSAYRDLRHVALLSDVKKRKIHKPIYY